MFSQDQIDIYHLAGHQTVCGLSKGWDLESFRIAQQEKEFRIDNTVMALIAEQDAKQEKIEMDSTNLFML